jgi:hypothetical protein
VNPPPAISYALFLQQVNGSFRHVLGDDEVVAAAKVVSGPPPYLLAWLAAVGGVALTALLSATDNASTGAHSWLDALWHAGRVVFLGPAAASLILAYFQRSMLMAVTREQVVLARRTAFRGPYKRIVVVPATSARITTGRRTRWTTTIVLDTPGTASLRLNAIKRRRAEMDQVLAAAQSTGVPISASAAIHDPATGTPAVLPSPPAQA